MENSENPLLARENAAEKCEVCGQEGAIPMGDHHLCPSCCHNRASCCSEPEPSEEA